MVRYGKKYNTFYKATLIINEKQLLFVHLFNCYQGLSVVHMHLSQGREMSDIGFTKVYSYVVL